MLIVADFPYKGPPPSSSRLLMLFRIKTKYKKHGVPPYSLLLGVINKLSRSVENVVAERGYEVDARVKQFFFFGHIISPAIETGARVYVSSSISIRLSARRRGQKKNKKNHKKKIRPQTKKTVMSSISIYHHSSPRSRIEQLDRVARGSRRENRLVAAAAVKSKISRKIFRTVTRIIANTSFFFCPISISGKDYLIRRCRRRFVS